MWKYILIYGLVPIILATLIAINENKITSENKFYYPRSFMIVGFIGDITIISIVFFCFLKEKFDYKMLILLPPMVLLFCGGFYLILAYFNWRLEFSDEHFVYTNFWGKTTLFQYSEILKVIIYPEQWRVPQKYKIVTTRKNITVECLVCNYSMFLKTLKKQMNKHKCRMFLEKKKSKVVK